jgi:hypothetical protein
MVQLTELYDEGDGEPEGGDGEDGGEDPLGGPAGGLEAHQDVSCVSSIPHDCEKAYFLSKTNQPLLNLKLMIFKSKHRGLYIS